MGNKLEEVREYIELNLSLKEQIKLLSEMQEDLESIELTYKQQRYVEEYVKSGNGRQAAINAGYSKHSAHSIAYENNAKPNIKKAIQEKLQEINSEGYIKLEKDTYDLLVDYCDYDLAKTARVLNKIIYKFLPTEMLTEEEQSYMKRRENILSNTRYAVLARAGFKCQACGAKVKKNNDVKLHIDHIQPHSLGGSDEIDNLQVLCQECNISKGNRFMVDHNTEYED